MYNICKFGLNQQNGLCNFTSFQRDLSRQSQWLSLKFQDAEKESEFTKHKDPYAGIYSAICPTGKKL